MRVYSIDPAKVREMQDPDSGAALRFDGSNAASVLQEIERHSSEDMVNRICEILSTIVPNTVHVRPMKHGNKLSLEFTQKWGEKKRLRFDAFDMSDGTLRALGLLMAVYQLSVPSLIAIEEPEATIHPGALGAVLDLLRHASRKMQVVVTTHSPELLEAEWIEDKHLRIVTWHEGATHVTPVSDAFPRALAAALDGRRPTAAVQCPQRRPIIPGMSTHCFWTWHEDTADCRGSWRGVRPSRCCCEGLADEAAAFGVEVNRS